MHRQLVMPVLTSKSAIPSRIGLIGVKTMLKLLKAFGHDESGAAAAEYALILAVVGGGIAAAALLLGQSIAAAMGRATAFITSVLP
jgi:pilus assembly protein Flp/PilA